MTEDCQALDSDETLGRAIAKFLWIFQCCCYLGYILLKSGTLLERAKIIVIDCNKSLLYVVFGLYKS